MSCLNAKGKMNAKAAAILGALLLMGLALRIAAILPFAMGPNTYSDDNGYLTSGVTFARTGYVAYADPGLQTSAIGPGMPVVLGLLLRLTGMDAQGLVAAHIAFSCFGLMTAIAAYLLGSLLCSRGAGLLAAGLCALDPSLISTNILFLTESPYMCLNLFAMYGFVRCAREWDFKSYWLGVACMLAAALFKGLALLVAVAAAAVLVRRRIKLVRWLPKAAVAALAFVLLWLTPLWETVDKKYCGAPFASYASAFGIGFAVLAGLPVAAILLMLTRVGLRLAFVLLFVYVAAIIAAPVFLGFFLGMLIWRGALKKAPCYFAELPIGILVWRLAACIPGLSFAAGLVAVPLGLGVITLLLGKGAKSAPAAPADGSSDGALPEAAALPAVGDAAQN